MPINPAVSPLMGAGMPQAQMPGGAIGVQMLPGGQIGAQMPGGQITPPQGRTSAFGANIPQLDPNQQTGFGLGPALGDIERGAVMGLDILDQTRQRVGQQFGQARGGLQPFVQPGQDANQLQAALSGALGPEAQATAFQNFQASPGQAWLQEQGDRALTRNAAALGGLGGGNVQRELVQFGQGLASQDLQNQFGRLGDVATRGLSAGTTLGGLGAQQAGIQSQIGSQAANIPFQGAAQAAQLRSGAGRDLATALSSTTSSLANLINQQGAGTSDVIGTGASNINQLIQMAQQGDANAMQQLGTVLANLGVQGASTFGAQPIIPGAQTNMLGQLGSVASGIGSLMSNLPENTQAPVTTSQPAFVR